MDILQAEAESREAEQMKKKLSKNDSASLSALIQRNQQSRERQMNSFFDDLAAKYADEDKTSKSTGRTCVTKKSAKKTSKTATQAAAKSQTKSKK